MKNLRKIERKIILAEAIFVLGVFVYLFFSTSPNQIYPLQGMVIIEQNFNIEIENGEEVLISTDMEFTNPIILMEGSDVFLPQGVYYWKARGNFRESEIRNFTIGSHVGLSISERPENYELRNSGNIDLNVTKEKKGITSSLSLDAGESKEVEKDDSNYEGMQK